MATKKPAVRKAKPARVSKEIVDAPDQAVAEELITVTAKKAFLGPGGWVQPGEDTDVTPARKHDLIRNGLVEGEGVDNDDVRPLGQPSDRSRKLHVSGGPGDQTKENT